MFVKFTVAMGGRDGLSHTVMCEIPGANSLTDVLGRFSPEGFLVAEELFMNTPDAGERFLTYAGEVLLNADWISKAKPFSRADRALRIVGQAPRAIASARS